MFSLATFSLVTGGCRGGVDESQQDPPRVVRVESVAREDAVERIDLLGDVLGERQVRVFSQVAEPIRILHVEDGSRVEAGDPIATLNSDLQSSSLAQADAALASAQASHAQIGADLARLQRLVGSGAVPQSQVEALQAQLSSSEAQLRQLSAARTSARTQRARTVIRAPISGLIGGLSVEQGDLAAPSAPLCTVYALDAVRVRLRVTEQDYVRIREGMSVTITPTALDDVERVGNVFRIAPVLDPVSRTAIVEVRTDNPDHALRPGMVAEVGIELARQPDTVLVPSEALILTARTDTEREAFVFVLDEGERHTVSRREIRLGRRYGRRVEVVDGLNGTEAVVVQGGQLLRDGAEVRLRSSDSSSPIAGAAAGGP